MVWFSLSLFQRIWELEVMGRLQRKFRCEITAVSHVMRYMIGVTHTFNKVPAALHIVHTLALMEWVTLHDEIYPQ